MIQIVLLAQERPSTLEEAAEWVSDALSRVATAGERPWSKRRVLAGLEGGTMSRMPMDLPTHRWVYRERTGAVRTVSVHVRVGAPLDDGPRRPGVELELEGWSSEELEPALFAEAGPRFVEAARAGRFSRGWVGPRAWTRERLNVWTLVEEAPQRRLPEEEGRIQVRFHWDTRTTGHPPVTAWVRVSQPGGGLRVRSYLHATRRQRGAGRVHRRRRRQADRGRLRLQRAPARRAALPP